MRYKDSDLASAEPGSGAEERLRRENDELRRELEQLRSASHASGGAPTTFWRPSALTLWALGLVGLVLLAIAFFAGYLPLLHRNRLIVDKAEHRERAVPRVTVVTVGRSSQDSSLQLPGNIQAITEAPILRAPTGISSND